MDIKKDGEAYLLSKISAKLTSEKDGDEFFKNYLVTAGRLKYTPKLCGEDFTIETEDLPFVFGVEECLERLIRSLDEFLREPYCSKTPAPVIIEPTVKGYSSEFILELTKLKKINLDYGWKNLFENLSVTVSKIEAIIARLVAVQTAGKRVKFFTNACAEDFLAASRIDFYGKAGLYFFAAGVNGSSY